MIGKRIRYVVVIHSAIHNLLVLLCNSLSEVQRMNYGERIRDAAVIHSSIHNLLYFYVTHELIRSIERMNYGERIKDAAVIHSAIHNLLVLLCNSHSEV